ncbi:hypothetical protein ACFE04_010781 [Oxalis oulophora]
MLMEHTHLKVSWLHHHIGHKDGYLLYTPPISPPPPLSPVQSSATKISPAVLFVIVVLAVLFFISGLLHLLVRFLIKHPSTNSGQSSSSNNNQYPEMSSTDALQRQLQQLFHLHDSGLDQAFIDALPVFHYKEIVGCKEPFDCAVCLCEFTEKDKLRLLPVCSHAFHIGCIDTWLLSNSTCPLCRGTLFTPGFSMENPIYDFDDFRDEEGCAEENTVTNGKKAVGIEEVVVEKGILPVRLGKFRKVKGEAESAGGETSSSNLDARRCYSMGSYQYVLANSNLRVALNNDRIARDIKLTKGTENNGNRNLSPDGDMEGKKITSVKKGESYSVSKIWLWSKKGSSGAPMHEPAPLNIDLPWMKNRQDK